MIIAIDGPAASGKGTLGKRLAKHYGYRHLDTGVIYRAVAKALLDAGADLTDEMIAVSAALELDPEKFGDPALKTQAVGDAASVVSAIPKVREVLFNFQRQFAADPARRGARWPRHRHRDLPGRRCEDFRRRRPQGARPPPHAGGARRAARTPTRRRCWRISSSATNATRTGPRAFETGRRMLTCLIIRIWI